MNFLSDLLKNQGRSILQNHNLDNYNIIKNSSLICGTLKNENSMKPHLVITQGKVGLSTLQL